MSEHKTELHLVQNLEQGLQVAHSLGAIGIGLDVEGVLIPYVGNTPTSLDLQNVENGSYLLDDSIHLANYTNNNPGVKYGLMTNNTNSLIETRTYGVVSYVSVGLLEAIKLDNVYKGKRLEDGTVVGKKPSGHQGKLLAEIFNIPVSEMVLIDDQGVKNAGEAVKAGFKAIIAPEPIGFKDERGRIIEHPGVMRFRKFEPSIYKSLERRGNLSATAFKLLAGIELNQIGFFKDHRDK